MLGGTRISLTGAVAATESIAPGLYQVSLVVSPGTGPASNSTAFYLLIPPRVSPLKRTVTGELHVRWAKVNLSGSNAWFMSVCGHVFDEMGSAIYGQSVSNLACWLVINSNQFNVALNSAGDFYSIFNTGQSTGSEYNVQLEAWAPGITNVMVDAVDMTSMQVFPPR